MCHSKKGAVQWTHSPLWPFRQGFYVTEEGSSYTTTELLTFTPICSVIHRFPLHVPGWEQTSFDCWIRQRQDAQWDTQPRQLASFCRQCSRPFLSEIHSNAGFKTATQLICSYLVPFPFRMCIARVLLLNYIFNSFPQTQISKVIWLGILISQTVPQCLSFFFLLLQTVVRRIVCMLTGYTTALQAEEKWSPSDFYLDAALVKPPAEQMWKTGLKCRQRRRSQLVTTSVQASH